MVQQWGNFTASVLQGIGQNRQIAERACFVDLLRDAENRGRSPDGVEVSRGPKRVADDATKQVGHHGSCFRDSGLESDVPGVIGVTGVFWSRTRSDTACEQLNFAMQADPPFVKSILKRFVLTAIRNLKAEDAHDSRGKVIFSPRTDSLTPEFSSLVQRAMICCTKCIQLSDSHHFK
jgi:hypothetical protein